jgi:hypothetical protein
MLQKKGGIHMETLQTSPEGLSVLLWIVLLIIAIVLLWVLPIILGVRKIKAKNYSTAWMCFGIYPLGAWIAYIVFCCLKPRIQCESCGGFVTDNFRICPFCHKETFPKTKMS